MTEPSQPYIYKFKVDALTNQERADQLTSLIKQAVQVEQIDVNLEKRLVRIISQTELDLNQLKGLSSHGFHLQKVDVPNSLVQPTTAPAATNTLTVGISGMTCHSCEITIERKWKKLAGVKRVEVNAGKGEARLTVEGQTPTISELQSALNDTKYQVHADRKKATQASAVSFSTAKRPSFMRLVGLFALVLFIGYLFSKLGLIKTNFNLGSAASFGTVFLIGLVAASSSCIAVVGGLLLSSAAKFNERYVSAKPLARMRPVALFVAGRITSYTILGGLLGVVGNLLSPPPLVTAVITIIAALYMLVMGLEMLHIAPSWLKRILPRMPKSLSHRILDAEKKEHPLAPFGLGAATFFLPCGFTQALQLYALTTGSFVAGATTLLAFALGTAPALLALGWVSSSLKGKVGRFFFQFSGALVIVLGLWNIQNGLTIAGYPLSLPKFSGAAATQAANTSGNANVTMDGNTQVIKMAVNSGGYQPNHFTLQAGKPVRWEVDGTKAQGCISVLTSRKLGIQKFLNAGINTIEFTPTEPGEIQFSCSMGMYRGSFTVTPSQS